MYFSGQGDWRAREGASVSAIWNSLRTDLFFDLELLQPQPQGDMLSFGPSLA